MARIGILLGSIMIGFSPSVWAGIIADSVAEFSGVQGQDGWYYGYNDGDSDSPWSSADFELMMDYSPSLWSVDLDLYWTQIGSSYCHPNGEITSGGKLPVEHWVVRRWISDVSGEIRLTGHIETKIPAEATGSSDVFLSTGSRSGLM